MAEKETPLAVPLARLLTTPDMWRTFAESYLEALDAVGRADPERPRTVYGAFDETRHQRAESLVGQPSSAQLPDPARRPGHHLP